MTYTPKMIKRTLKKVLMNICPPRNIREESRQRFHQRKETFFRTGLEIRLIYDRKISSE